MSELTELTPMLIEALEDERAGRPLLAQAADRINDLEAEVKALKAEKDTAWQYLYLARAGIFPSQENAK